MERVKKGEKYWYLSLFSGTIFIEYDIEHEDEKDSVASLIDKERFLLGNYFTTKEEAEVMAKKLRAVLNGADVIEMPSEEDASFESVHLLGLSGHDDGDRREEAYLDGFADCLHWLKSKVK